MTTTQSDEDFFSSLDESIAKVTNKEELLAKQSRLKKALRPSTRHNGTQHLQLGHELEQVTRQLEAIQWRSMASVALFAAQHCDNCGSDHSMFLHHMQRQQTTSGPKCQRWVRATKPDPSLPREVVKQFTVTHVCGDCCGEFGFDLEKGDIKFARDSEPFATSLTAIQEEIEG